MNKYLNYLKEREGIEIIDHEYGFIFYKFLIDREGSINCYISDYFVNPEKRCKGYGYQLADSVFKLCREKGIKTVYCQSDISAKNHSIAALSILNYGFKIYRLDRNLIYYYMEVDSWEK